MKYSTQKVAIETKDFGQLLFTAHSNTEQIDTSNQNIFSIQIGCDKDLMNSIPLVRIHSECVTGDLFGSMRCDCGDQLKMSLEMMRKANCGILIYLRQEGRGIGLFNKLKAYTLQDNGLDTVEANQKLGLPIDDRNYADAASILKEYYMKNTVRLLTNNPIKIKQLEEHGINVSCRIPLIAPSNKFNKDYLRAKSLRMGHFIRN